MHPKVPQPDRMAARPPVDCFVGLGANLGDAAHTLGQALVAMHGLPFTQVVAVSYLYTSAPVGASGPDYTNAVAHVYTQLGPMDLLAALQGIETQHGRERPYPNAPRTLDLDLLCFGDARITAPNLVVPHPRMWQRAFVVLPLAELAPQRVDAKTLAGVAGQAIVRTGLQPRWR